MAFEVEQKFSISADTREKLAALGALKQKDCLSFTDIYYDTNNNSLTFNDFWLRQRNGSWQLKSPLKSHASKPLTDKYKETENEEDILKLLREFGFLKQDDSSLQQLVDLQFLSAISEFTTIREVWLLPSSETEGLSGGNVVLDSTNGGYKIGEVEVMADTQALTDQAEEFVKKMAAKIGTFLNF